MCAARQAVLFQLEILLVQCVQQVGRGNLVIACMWLAIIPSKQKMLL
jgi:hypothetical protein